MLGFVGGSVMARYVRRAVEEKGRRGGSIVVREPRPPIWPTSLPETGRSRTVVVPRLIGRRRATAEKLLSTKEVVRSEHVNGKKTSVETRC